MNPRNLRNVFMAGAALRHIMMASDGEDDGGAGGAPPADPPAASDPPEGDPPSDGGTGGEGGDGGSDDPPPPPKSQRTPWQAKRIDALTAQAKTAQEEAERLRIENQQSAQQLAAYKALYGDNAAPGSAATPPPATSAERTYTQSELNAEAQRIAALNTLNQKCETLFDQGSKSHSASWNDRVNQAGQAFGKDLLNRVDFFEALTKLPNSVDVYHELAGDLDHMSEVLAMAPIDLGMELSRMSSTLNTKPKVPPVSRAPTPIEPIDGTGASASDDLEKMSMSDFAKAREKQREERFKSRGYS